MRLPSQGDSAPGGAPDYDTVSLRAPPTGWAARSRGNPRRSACSPPCPVSPRSGERFWCSLDLGWQRGSVPVGRSITQRSALTATSPQVSGLSNVMEVIVGVPAHRCELVTRHIRPQILCGDPLALPIRVGRSFLLRHPVEREALESLQRLFLRLDPEDPEEVLPRHGQ